MVRMFSLKKAMVISVLVFILSFMQIGTFSDQGWELKTQLPTERITFATAVVSNKICLIGGTLYENVRPDKAVLGPYGISTVEVYDTQTNTWQKGTDMPTPRHGAKTAVVNNTIFVFGGWNGEADHALREYPVSVEAYNLQTDTWIQKKDMPISRVEFGVGVVDGKIYIIGGAMRVGGERMSRVDVYNPVTDTWVKGREMSTPREALGVGVVGNRIYAIGGRGWPRVRILGPHLTVIEEYNPTSRQWRQRSDMLDPRDSFAPVVVTDSIYLIGGAILKGAGFAPEYLASVNVYNPQKDTSDNIPAMPISLVPGGAAAVNGRIYVFGGIGDVGEGLELFPDVMVYDTGFRAVEATGKLSTRWGELKAPQQNHP